MPSFVTPEPISVQLDLMVADVTITAGTGVETTVDVVPTGNSNASARSADETEVNFTGSTLEISQPQRKFRPLSEWVRPSGVELRITLPAGSRVGGRCEYGAVRALGELGEVRLQAGAGDIELDATGPLFLDAANGRVAVKHVAGPLDVNSANGDIWFGTVDGPAKLHASSGNVSIDHVNTDAEINTVNGNLRVGEVRSGSVSLQVTTGSIDLGIPKGTAAFLDAHASLGSVRNGLTGSEHAPENAVSTVQVMARSHMGSIDVHRA